MSECFIDNLYAWYRFTVLLLKQTCRSLGAEEVCCGLCFPRGSSALLLPELLPLPSKVPASSYILKWNSFCQYLFFPHKSVTSLFCPFTLWSLLPGLGFSSSLGSQHAAQCRTIAPLFLKPRGAGDRMPAERKSLLYQVPALLASWISWKGFYWQAACVEASQRGARWLLNL